MTATNAQRWSIAAAIGVAVAATLFYILTHLAVLAGVTAQLDAWVIDLLRHPTSEPIGPEWLPKAVRDLTSLGGESVRLLVVMAVSGFLLVRRKPRAAALVFAAAAGAQALSIFLKQAFPRERPPEWLRLEDVSTPGFPSSHAMMSVVIYPLVALALLYSFRGAHGSPASLKNRLTVRYLLGFAVVTALLVGASRVYLGVHYPTDVVAGWAAGLAWLAACHAALLRLLPARESTPQA